MHLQVQVSERLAAAIEVDIVQDAAPRLVWAGLASDMLALSRRRVNAKEKEIKHYSRNSIRS
jgi:hypothetical protein